MLITSPAPGSALAISRKRGTTFFARGSALLGILFLSHLCCAQTEPGGANLTNTFEDLLRHGGGTNWSYVEAWTRKQGKEQQIRLGKQLLAHTNGVVVYYGANLLIENGLEKESMPALGSLIISGRAARDLHGRLGYDWVHTKDEKQAGRLICLLMVNLADAYAKADNPGKQRIQEFSRGMGFSPTAAPFSATTLKSNAFEKLEQLTKQK